MSSESSSNHIEVGLFCSTAKEKRSQPAVNHLPARQVILPEDEHQE